MADATSAKQGNGSLTLEEIERMDPSFREDKALLFAESQALWDEKERLHPEKDKERIAGIDALRAAIRKKLQS